MLCPVCFAHCGTDNGTSFGMYFQDVNESFALLPCFVTERFPKHFAGGFLNFRAQGRRYVVHVYTGYNNTRRISGKDLRKFMKDFNLGHGQLVVFVMIGRIANAYVCSLGPGFFHGGGAEAAQQEEEQGGGDEEEVQPDDAGQVNVEGNNGQNVGEAPPGIIYSRDVNLVVQEADRLATIIAIDEGHIGSRFVHRFTTTNVIKKSMKIPNQVRLVLNIGDEGFIGVRLGEGLLSRVAFQTSKDGRMVFNNKWGVFVTTYNLREGSAAVFTFQRSNAGIFDVICVVDILTLGV